MNVQFNVIVMKKGILILIFSLLLCGAPLVAQTAQKEMPKAQISAVSNTAGTLTVNNHSGKTTSFTVYSITGQVVKVIELKAGSSTFSLPQGFYIVKTDDYTMKVAVK